MPVIATAPVQAGTIISLAAAGQKILSADLNLDGKQDILVQASTQLTVVLGNGDGTFQNPVTVAAGPTPNSMAIGDFNQDEKVDVVVLNGAANTFSVLLGNGDGTFQTPVSYPIGFTDFLTITTADFDKDGKVDIAMTSKVAGVVIFHGNGDGTFAAGGTFSYGGGVVSDLAASDMNMDGNLDLVMALNSLAQVGILTGNGDGTFQPASNGFSSGGSFLRLGVGDFNLDGKPDVALPLSSLSSAAVLPGKGDGTLEGVLYFAAGNTPYGCVVADLNNDHKPDLVVTNLLGSTISVVINTSVDALPPTVAITPLGGTFGEVQTVTLSCYDQVSGCESVYYTIDGSEPSYPPGGSTLVYSAPLTIPSTTTLKYFARDLAGNSSAPQSQTYTLPATYSLSIAVIGNGIVHTTPAPDLACTGGCGQSYDNGTVVNLSPTPTVGYVFGAWSGCTLVPMSLDCWVTMDAAKEVTATFNVPPTIITNPTTYTFGDRQVGTGAVSQLFTLTNSGGLPLVVGGISLSGDGVAAYSVTTGSCGSLTPTIAAGGSCTVNVIFNPTAQQLWSATLNITSNDPVTPTATIPISGKGVGVLFDLSLGFSGAGTGTVGISTGGTCTTNCSQSFGSGAVVTLTPMPDYTAAFSGWTGCDSVTGTICIVTMTGFKQVVAQFSATSQYDEAWTEGNLFGGSVNAFAISPAFSTDHTIFASTSFGGIYRTKDSAESWQKISSGINTNDMQNNVIEISPNYSSDKTLFAASLWGKLYKTTSDGESWNQVHVFANPTWDYIKDIKFSPSYATDFTVYVATEGGGIFKSLDAGVTWNTINTGLSSLTASKITISPNFAVDNTIFCVTGNGIYKSTNRGTTWALSTTLVTYGPLAFSPGFVSDQTLFAGSWSSGTLYKTVNGGSTWTVVKTGFTSLREITISPAYATDRTFFVRYSASFVRTTDDGATWTELLYTGVSGGNSSVVLSLGFVADNTLFLAFPGSGVLRSTDKGINWARKSQGIRNSTILSSAFSPFFASDRTVFVGTNMGGLHKSSDGGISWSYALNELKSQSVRSITVSPDYSSDHTLFITTGNGYKSIDGGTTWSTLSGTGYVGLLAISPNYTADQTIFAGDNGNNIKISTDGGNSWSALNTNFGSVNMLSIAVSPGFATDRTVLVGTSGGIYKSIDGGASWSLVNAAFTGAVYISPNYVLDQTLLTVRNYILYKSTDSGNNWTQLSTNSSVLSVAFSPN